MSDGIGVGLPPLPPLAPVPVLARVAHDRIAHRRTDTEWLEQRWADKSTRVLVLSAASITPVTPDGAVKYFDPAQIAEAGIDGDRVLLGAAEGIVYFAVLAYTAATTAAIDADWRGLRDLAVDLSDLDVGLMTAAVALQEWHQRHGHCPRCGAVTEVAQAGWTRRCPQDFSEHFPRTDPAVIMLVHDGAGRCVLARGPQWNPGRMSVLAGFVEAGESAEAAVRREVFEEVGISVRDVRYVASQPHPFPASLMLGFTAVLDGDATLRLDGDEIAEAAWFSRDEVRRVGDWGQEEADSDAMLRGLPSELSIARQLINAWVAEGD
ncbi:MAG TPA: NAD(+) diphosphatase [Jatrophihabitans sp.]|jgi:NAD+ diphosphatase